MNPIAMNWFRLATVMAIVFTVMMAIFVGIGEPADTTDRIAWMAVIGYIIGFSGEIADTFIEMHRASLERKAA